MTANTIFNWVFGPHIVGVLYLLIGALQHYYPPKKINKWYGYRTGSSQKNQQNWDEANRFSAIYMMKCGVVVIIAGLMIVALINVLPMQSKLKQGLTIFSVMLSAILPPILMIVTTEKYLKNTFGDK